MTAASEGERAGAGLVTRAGWTHKLTCFRDERIQALGVPECLAPTCSAFFQPILLGWAGWATRGSPCALNCLLLPLSLETHSSVSIGQMEMLWIWTCDPFWERLKMCSGTWDGAWIGSRLQSENNRKHCPKQGTIRKQKRILTKYQIIKKQNISHLKDCKLIKCILWI